jgi:flagellin-like hook-associated protein FlgL
MDQTQERLSSGKKVNSAIDNPSSYYTAQSLTNRASDLSGLLDSMGQAVSTIKAANEGIESITTFVEQAKAVATAAVDTTDDEVIELVGVPEEISKSGVEIIEFSFDYINV